MTLFTLAFEGTVLASRQCPNHPYSTQDVVSAGVAFVGVAVGSNVVVSRHPPNHPYFTHDVVGNSVVEVEVEELVELEVLVSSRHPRNYQLLVSVKNRVKLRTPPSRCLAGCSSRWDRRG